MIWILIIIVVIILFAIGGSKNSPEAEIKKLFEEAEEYFQFVQNDLKQKIKPYKKDEAFESKREYEELQNENRLDYQINELRRKHVITIMTSEKFTAASKKSAVKAWNDLVDFRRWMIYGINSIGVDIEQIKEQAGRVHTAESTFNAVMEALGYDMEKETEELKKKISSHSA